jgi:hypothetical protein
MLSAKKFTPIPAIPGLLFFHSISLATSPTEGSSNTTFSPSGFTGAGFSTTPAAGQIESDDIIATGLSDVSLTFPVGTYEI